MALLREPVVNALVSLVVEVRTCNAGVEVRFLPGAPKFCIKLDVR